MVRMNLRRKEVRDFCFKYKDGKSSERIFELIWKNL